jgi:hypothetical protein
MKQRGRKSAAELSIIGAGGIAVARRLDPPSQLSDEMADIWRGIVNGKPGDWFDAGSAPVLAQYCRHVIAARRASQLVVQTEADDGFDIDVWSELLRLQERQSALLVSLATKLRLTPQSRYGARSAATAALNESVGPPPWEE